MRTAVAVLLGIAIAVAVGGGRALAAQVDDAALEAYAWSEDRDAALRRFAPGSDDHWYYRILRLQQTGKLAEAEKALDDWSSQRAHAPAPLSALRLRQAALWSDSDPARAYHDLAGLFGVYVPSRPEAPGPSGTELDPKQLDADAFTGRAEQDGGVGGFTDAGVWRLLPRLAWRGRAALERIAEPDAPGLVDAIVDDLDRDKAEEFGALPIHRHLTRAQLAEVARRVPRIADHPGYVETVLAQEAAAHADAAWRRDDRALGAYLDAILARCVGPAFAYARELALAHRLALELRGGGDGLATLRELNAARHDAASPVAKVDRARAAAFTGLDDIGGEAETAAVLDAALARAEDPAALADLLPADELRVRFAAAKVLAGVGDPASWFGRLDAETADRLQRGAEVAFAPTQRQRFAPDDRVELALSLRNAPTLLVRVFALDQVAVLRRTLQPLSAELDLTGLEPSQELRFEYREPPYRRHFEIVPLPQLAGAGAWIVEVVGGGHAARALIRKGSLMALPLPDPAGLRLRLLDERGEAVAGGEAWIGPAHFSANAEGDILVPFSASRERAEAVLTAGGRAAVQGVRLAEEDYQLDARLLLEREQLLADTEATAMIHARPMLGRRALPASSLLRPRLALQWVMADGQTIAGEDQPLALRDDGETTARLRVPGGALGLKWRLTAAVASRSRPREQPELSDEGAIWINGVFATTRCEGWFLRHGADGWVLEARGLAGEPQKRRRARLELTHRIAAKPFTVDVVCGDDGRLALGALDGITALRLFDGDQLRETWSLMAPSPSVGALRLAAGASATVPFIGGEGTAFALYRANGEAWVEELTDRVAAAPGALTLRALDAGEYRLVLRARDRDQVVPVTVVAGAAHGAVVAGPALAVAGDPPALGISAESDADGVAIHLVNAGAQARVHALGCRAWPGGAPSPLAAQHALDERIGQPENASSFLSQRALADEERYILDRRGVSPLPGVMLERPGLLLNPWAPASLNANVPGGFRTLGGCRAGGGRASEISKAGGSKLPERDGQWSCLDWLAPPVLLTGLRAGADGVVRIPRAQLGDAHALVLEAVDGERGASTVIALPPVEPARRERRLDKPLESGATLGVRTELVALAAGESTLLPAGPGARWRVIDSAAALLSALRAANPDAGLEVFEPLTRWNHLDAAERRRVYEALASHEAHLFLARHDPDGFKRELAPYLANKAQPTFVDRWLTDGDLAPWSASLRLDQALNPCERALFALKGGADAAAQAGALRDAAAAEPPDPDQQQSFADALLAFGGARGGGVDSVAETQTIELDSTGRERGDRSGPAPFYAWPRPPQVLVESEYYREEEPSSAVTSATLWSELAAADARRPFLPTVGLERLRSRTELLLALALIDLPLAPGEHKREATAGGEKLTAASPMLVVMRAPRALPQRAGELAVHARVLRADEAMSDRATARPCGPRLAPLTPYLDVATLVNLTGERLRVEVLQQVPAGAVALCGEPATRARTLVLGPYASREVDLAFYFPEPGERAQAPIRANDQEHLLAAGDPATWTVVDEAPTRSWMDADDPKAVLASLAKVPLAGVDLSPLEWRMDDAGFWRAAIETLRARRRFEPALWKFAFLHGDERAAREFLEADDEFRADCCGVIDCRLARIDALRDGSLPLVEIAPLTNPRAHRVGGERALGHPAVAERYRELLRYLAHRTEADDLSRLALACLLLLEDRGAEAQAAFARVDAAKLATRLQYDYCRGYLALMRGELAEARRVAEAYREHPVERWRRRFGELLGQLDEVAKPAETIAGTTASLRVERASATMLAIRADGVAAGEVRWHPIDLEALFSASPFAIGDDAERIAVVAPALTQPFALEPGERAGTVAIPEAWQARDAVVEVAGGGTRAATLCLAAGVDVAVLEEDGLVRVRDRSGAPVAGAYVKVYRDEGDAYAAFHKDGYTDRRGLFDYVALSSPPPRMKRFALFVDGGRAGTAVRIAIPPQR